MLNKSSRKEITIPGRRAETHSLHRCNSRPFPQAPGRHPATRTGHRLYSSLVLNIGESVAADFGEREKIDGKQNELQCLNWKLREGVSGQITCLFYSPDYSDNSTSIMQH